MVPRFLHQEAQCQGETYLLAHGCECGKFRVRLHWLASVQYGLWVFTREVYSEMHVGNDEVASSKALIGLQVLCQRVTATHSENPATETLPGCLEGRQRHFVAEKLKSPNCRRTW